MYPIEKIQAPLPASGAAEDAFVPFADSPIWDMQRRYFQLRGVNAWHSGEVPYYVTSHAAMAHAYAALIERYLSDLSLCGALDPAAPIYLVELGCGSGYFAHHFLHCLDDMNLRGALPQMIYVLSDLAADNLESVLQNEQFASWRERGELDCAVFDAECDSAIELMTSKRVLRPGELANPLIVIANYVFDGIRCDLFFAGDGRLERGEVAVQQSPAQANTGDLPDIEAIELSYRRQPQSQPAYPAALECELLQSYAQLEGSRAVLYPRHGIDCMHRLMQLSSAGVIISADRGHHQLDKVLHRRAPDPARHGSFSLPVNYHALGAVLQSTGAAVMQTVQRHAGLNFMAASWGDRRPHDNLRRVFQQRFAQFGPDDAFLLKKSLEQVAPQLSAERLLAHLRACCFDARVFSLCAPALMKVLPYAPATTRHAWRDAVLEVERRYLRQPGEVQLANNIRVVLMATEGASLPKSARAAQRLIYQRAPSRHARARRRGAVAVVSVDKT